MIFVWIIFSPKYYLFKTRYIIKMKRVSRLGSLAFLTVLISFTCHIIAISYDQWKTNTCVQCTPDDPIGTWNTAILTRCYPVSLDKIFIYGNYTNSNSFQSKLCVTNQFFMIKDISQASYCLQLALQDFDSLCSILNFDQRYCQCDYSTQTKLILSMTILTSFSLGFLIFLSHLVSFVRQDHVLQWLIPICYIDLIFAIMCILVTLFTAGTNLYDDVNEIRYSWSIIDAAFYNESETFVDNYRQNIVNQINVKYSVTLGWCFGLELLAFYFAILSLVLYLLMALEKRHPGSIKVIQ